MANETFLQGDDIILSIWDTSAYEPIACLTSNTLSESLEVREVTTKCDPGNIVKTPGSYSYEISMDGIYIDGAVDTGKQSHGDLASLMRAKTEITWRLTTELTSPTHYYGTGYITSLELTGDADDNATFSATISGTGAIATVDPQAT